MSVVYVGQNMIIADHNSKLVTTQLPDGYRVQMYQPALSKAEAASWAMHRGYNDIWLFLCDHELFHTWLACKQGLPYSPALYAAAHQQPCNFAAEEFFVCQFQRYVQTRLVGNSLLCLQQYGLESLAAEARYIRAQLTV